MLETSQKFDHYFYAISYLVTVCGLFALFFSGGIGVIALAFFIFTTVSAWLLEDSRWQFSERIGVVVIILVIPIFVLNWRFQILGSGAALATGSLARLILFLCAIKLFQKKTHRDWVFIYIISFFEMLLAAGLSISPVYLAILIAYLFCMICAITAFEVQKSAKDIIEKKKLAADIRAFSRNRKDILGRSIKRLPVISFALLVLTVLFAIPLFFVIPRVGGAGLGGNSGGGSPMTGFSDSVRLGEIGKLKLSDENVMRVQIDEPDRARIGSIYWRGVTLDSFNNQSWSRSRRRRPVLPIRSDIGEFLVNPVTATSRIIEQTYYLEPTFTSVLFTLARPITIRGNFTSIRKDSDDSIKVNGLGFERTSYSIKSDVSLPDREALRADRKAYTMNFRKYLSLPRGLDPKIKQLADRIASDANARSRYDKARAIERFLQTRFGYTLELRAGGAQPLSDFLFNVREGHCEYFATAMAIMLRTQGVATRVVNGFQRGDYNETAGVYVVKQRDAHSWVEVYFAEQDAWITFDPTPAAGQYAENQSITVAGQFNEYLEALETFWIQYVVAYDSQEQRSLLNTFKVAITEYKNSAAAFLFAAQTQLVKWWEEVRGDKGLQASVIAISYAVGYLILGILGILILIWFLKRIVRLAIWSRLANWLRIKNEATVVEFYERMQRVLKDNGYERKPHQTPLEFVSALKMPEAVRITEKYNRVRFGEKALTREESKEIESWLNRLSQNDPG
ncbi:MAG: DUF3488 domain-containing protein [Pyrinomonadaceae bacterium]|nr:DUF3488 domain-containing protein [Pyrinomonadaceae bacterium]